MEKYDSAPLIHAMSVTHPLCPSERFGAERAFGCRLRLEPLLLVGIVGAARQDALVARPTVDLATARQHHCARLRQAGHADALPLTLSHLCLGTLFLGRPPQLCQPGHLGVDVDHEAAQLRRADLMQTGTAEATTLERCILLAESRVVSLERLYGRIALFDDGVLLVDGVGQGPGALPLLGDDAVLLFDSVVLLEDGTISLLDSHSRVVQFCERLEVVGLPWTDRHDEGHLGIPHRRVTARVHLGQDRHHRAGRTQTAQLPLENAKQRHPHLAHRGLRSDFEHANPRTSVVVAHNLHNRLVSCIVGLQQSGAVLPTALRNGVLDSLSGYQHIHGHGGFRPTQPACRHLTPDEGAKKSSSYW
mmetsp:Transcript_17401/g.49380  ORF Transcript_17401/g.49380 Transcript_17401/m.49380 type:complete len:361 (+) Transcript_17401:40-1122(+)